MPYTWSGFQGSGVQTVYPQTGQGGTSAAETARAEAARMAGVNAWQRAYAGPSSYGRANAERDAAVAAYNTANPSTSTTSGIPSGWYDASGALNPMNILGSSISAYQTAQDQARAANLERYGQILTGYETRETQAAGLGAQQLEDLRTRYGEATGAGHQQLAARGMYGTSNMQAYDLAQQRNLSADTRGLQDTLTREQMDLSGQRLAFMERRTDEYPQPGAAAQVGMNLGMYGGYAGGGGGGAQFAGGVLGFSDPNAPSRVRRQPTTTASGAYGNYGSRGMFPQTLQSYGLGGENPTGSYSGGYSNFAGQSSGTYGAGAGAGYSNMPYNWSGAQGGGPGPAPYTWGNEYTNEPYF